MLATYESHITTEAAIANEIAKRSQSNRLLRLFGSRAALSHLLHNFFSFFLRFPVPSPLDESNGRCVLFLWPFWRAPSRASSGAHQLCSFFQGHILPAFLTCFRVGVHMFRLLGFQTEILAKKHRIDSAEAWGNPIIMFVQYASDEAV
jgi:hypothetical protein